VTDTGDWFDCPKHQVHAVLVPYLQHLADTQRETRLLWDEIFLGMFLDAENVSILPSRGLADQLPSQATSGVPLNVVQPAVMTLESRIAVARPRPFYLGVDADPDLARMAKKMQRWTDGAYDEVQAYAMGQELILSAAIFGTVGCKAIVRNGRPAVEKVMRAEILVDESLGQGMNPRERGEVREVSKGALLKQFPKHKAAIQALGVLTTSWGNQTSYTDLVRVFEWTRLPENGKPGRRVIVIPGATLVDVEHTRPYFDVFVLRFANHPTSFFGIGIPDILKSIQASINRKVRSVEANLRLHSNPIMLLPEQGNIVPAQIRSVPGTILRVRKGLEPQLQTHVIMPPEVYRWIWDLVQQAARRVGISEMSQGAVKPAGIDSGKGIESLSELQADRLSTVSQRYEQAIAIDMSTRILDACEDAFKVDPDFSVVAKDRGRAEKLFWRDVRSVRESLSVQVMASNFIGRTPAAAFTDIERALKLGIIEDPADAAELMQFPDIQRLLGDRSAAKEQLEKQVEAILEQGEDGYVDPNPYGGVAGLQLGLRVYNAAYNRAQLDSVPEDRLGLLQKYMDETLDLIKSLQPVAPAQPNQEPGAQQ
jgi:hypothetical protein